MNYKYQVDDIINIDNTEGNYRIIGFGKSDHTYECVRMWNENLTKTIVHEGLITLIKRKEVKFTERERNTVKENVLTQLQF